MNVLLPLWIVFPAIEDTVTGSYGVMRTAKFLRGFGGGSIEGRVERIS
jgi:hypothetical protein